MSIRRVLPLALLALASCAGPEGPAPTRPGQSAAADRPSTSARSRSPAPRAGGDTCGAKALQSLIGRPRAEIPVPVDLSRRRVTCPAVVDAGGTFPPPAITRSACESTCSARESSAPPGGGPAGGSVMSGSSA